MIRVLKLKLQACAISICHQRDQLARNLRNSAHGLSCSVSHSDFPLRESYTHVDAREPYSVVDGLGLAGGGVHPARFTDFQCHVAGFAFDSAASGRAALGRLCVGIHTGFYQWSIGPFDIARVGDIST